ncbi:hypothetical protein ACFL1M_02810 [Patescibacteria group bacterium]
MERDKQNDLIRAALNAGGALLVEGDLITKKGDRLFLNGVAMEKETGVGGTVADIIVGKLSHATPDDLLSPGQGSMSMSRESAKKIGPTFSNNPDEHERLSAHILRGDLFRRGMIDDDPGDFEV